VAAALEGARAELGVTHIAAATTLQVGHHAAGETAGQRDFIDLGFDQHLARRHVQLAQQFQDLLVLLRGGLDEQGVVERVRHHARTTQAGLRLGSGCAQVGSGDVGLRLGSGCGGDGTGGREHRPGWPGV
jgi:hypothetical protein